MDEISRVINSRPASRLDMEKLVIIGMAEVVFGSNQFERLGVDLDETLRLCLLVFSGEKGLKNVDRYVDLCRYIFDGIADDHVEAQGTR